MNPVVTNLIYLEESIDIHRYLDYEFPRYTYNRMFVFGFSKG
jgi:hypothetical protein